MEPVLLFVVAGIALAGFAWYGHVQARKRRELLQQFAASQGWTWVPEDDRWTERFSGTPFDDGDNRRARNVLTGSWHDRPMLAMDYSYETHSTDSKGHRTTETHRYAVCSLGLPVWVPRVELIPEGVLGRLGTVLGMQDIELESEDFNRRYRVRSDNPKFACDVLVPRTMEALLARPSLHLRLAGPDALCWESGLSGPADLLARLDALSVLLDGVPDFVWSDLKEAT